MKVKASELGQAVAIEYRRRNGRKGVTLAHRFGKRVRIGHAGRFLIIGPITIRKGEIHG